MPRSESSESSSSLTDRITAILNIHSPKSSIDSMDSALVNLAAERRKNFADKRYKIVILKSKNI